MQTSLIARQLKATRCPWLRWHTGYTYTRKAFKPIYAEPGWKAKPVGLEETDQPVKVFHLCGYGQTLDEAERMARKVVGV